jgi:hypothetical protein
MNRSIGCVAPLAVLLVSLGARADTVADWADTTTEIATDGPNTVRTMALAQNAVYEAVNAITSRYPRDHVNLDAAQDASIDAAIAAASRAVLLHEAPALKQQTEAAYDKSLHALPDDDARMRGVNIGVRAAEDVLAKHSHDIGAVEPYRPLTTPGTYVPTTFPLGYAVAQHQPWFMKTRRSIGRAHRPLSRVRCGHETTSKSRPSAQQRVRYARRNKPKLRDFGPPRCLTSIWASCAPSPPPLGAT